MIFISAQVGIASNHIRHRQAVQVGGVTECHALVDGGTRGGQMQVKACPIDEQRVGDAFVRPDGNPVPHGTPDRVGDGAVTAPIKIVVVFLILVVWVVSPNLRS